MRKFLVKHFVLNYSFKIGKTTFTALRASRILFPMFIIAAILTAINPIWPVVIWYTGVAYALLAITVWFGFFHWEYFPAKWNEMDEDQKWQYGIAIRSGQLTKPKSEYDEVDWDEWDRLNYKRLNK